MFMVSFGMFASVIFLPRFYQGVRGISATESGYMMWPLLVGLMGVSIGSGALISRIGRYKWILTGAMILVMAGSFLMTHITMNTSNGMLWLWMFIMGAGIGPAMSGTTVVVQNSAPRDLLGTATSTLTFIRQVGGSVGLAIAGTVFSQNFTQLLPRRLAAHGVPSQVVQHVNAAGSSGGNLAGVGLATQLQHSLPPQLQALIPNIVAGVHDAFSLAIGDVFWLSVAGGAVAFFAFLLIPDLQLRGATRTQAATADVVTGADVPAQEAAS
jgi:MFS family permease